MTLEQLYDHALSTAEGLFATRGEVRPMYLCESKDGTIFPMAVPSGIPKDLLVFAMRQFIREQDIVRYAFLSEAWLLSLSTDKAAMQASQREIEEAYRRYGSLEHHPDRIEAVSVIVEEKGRSLSGFRQILRPEHGKPTLAPASEKTSTNVGRMSGLFDEARH